MVQAREDQDALYENNQPDWFDRVPKGELHLHLEGAIPLETQWMLVQKYGGDADFQDLAALKRRFIYRDFSDFLQTWVWKNRFLREAEDFTLIATAVAHNLAAQSIRYAEVFYSPGDFNRYGLETQTITQSIRAGLDRVRETKVALIVDLVRNYGPEKAYITLNQVNEVRDEGVIGVGLGGAELEYPPEIFESVYSMARDLGFHTCAHAGEAAGSASIWGAVRRLQVERIGHGTRAGEDLALLDYLAESKLPLEMCPLSNIATGVVGRIEEHPIRQFFDRGLRVTVNTDDPGMFGNTLGGEYRLLVEKLGFSRDEIRTLILNGIHSSWLLADEKLALERDFTSDPGWIIEDERKFV